MKLSYVIVTFNRRGPLLRTLDILRRTTPLPAGEWEAWVVDNGSTDGSCQAVREQFPDVHLIERPTNEGVWSRSYAFAPARGQYLILLDDDSYPIGDAAAKSIDYLDAHPACGAVVGLVILPDGSYEACAFPAVMLSGAVCIRKSVLARIGGFRREFFRKAGEYDVSFRIWDAGYSVERFEDIVYRHDKVMTGRSSALAHRMDLRNNLILVERYLPARLRPAYRDDWRQRYTALGRHAGCGRAARVGLWQARGWRAREALTGRQTLSAGPLEAIFDLKHQAAAIGAWARDLRVRSVVIQDFSKNLFATYRGCREAGLNVHAVADAHPAFAGMEYRGVPIFPPEAALALEPEGIVISNVNPAQIDRAVEQSKKLFAGPVLRLWEPRYVGDAGSMTETPTVLAPWVCAA
jgi:GT2 family glycosyltransferase